MTSILDYFPYEELRAVQEEVLLQLERDWERYDVFVIVAPTALGKSATAITIADWARDARITTPNNMLIKQYKNSFPDLATIQGGANYTCEKYPQYGCAERKGSCTDCPLTRDRQRFQFKEDIQVCNNHYHKVYIQRKPNLTAPEVFIGDEAHNLIPFQRDTNTHYIWKHRQGYPDGVETKERLIEWVCRQKPTHATKALYDALTAKYPTFVVDKEEDWKEWSAGGSFRGEKLRRGEPELVARLKIVPIHLGSMVKSIWPKKTKKIVLLSATIGRKDVESLGLGKRKVRYYECAHPIAAASRPIVAQYVTSVSHSNFESATKKICDHIEQNLLPHHKGEKGLVHCTYAQADIMRKYFKSDRFLFHDRDNKKRKYQEFLDSSPESGTVLVASGMYEGLDLPEDLGRWQVVAKVPWPSLADAAIAHLAALDEEWYEWQTLKDIIQACGRICRTPEDWGVSYILDGSFARLETNKLVPSWFSEAFDKDG